MTKMVDETIRPEWIAEAKENGVSYTLLKSRLLDHDWHIEDAISKSPDSKEKYGGWVREALANGISRATFYDRIYRGYSPEEAATVKRFPRKIDHEETLYDHLEVALKNGINRGTFWNRIYRGADPVKASTIPAKRKGGNTRHESAFI